jgi:hypothetical protein
MSKQRERYRAHKDTIFRDKPTAYHASVAQAFGDTKAAVYFLQLYWWSFNKSAIERGGWFWKTKEEMYQETGLSEAEQVPARKFCVKHGLIKSKRDYPSIKWHTGEVVKDFRRVTWFWVDHARLKQIMDDYYDKGKILKQKKARNPGQTRGGNGRFAPSKKVKSSP